LGWDPEVKEGKKIDIDFDGYGKKNENQTKFYCKFMNEKMITNDMIETLLSKFSNG
jgi:phosphoribosylformylglycinamidine (FGAM) synthase PurS component